MIDELPPLLIDKDDSLNQNNKSKLKTKDGFGLDTQLQILKGGGDPHYDYNDTPRNN